MGSKRVGWGVLNGQGNHDEEFRIINGTELNQVEGWLKRRRCRAVVVFSAIALGSIGSPGCRDPKAERNEAAQLLTVEGGELHLLDHLDGAAIVDIPLFEELKTSEALAKRFQSLLAMQAYQPKELKLFPVDADQVRLTNMTIDPQTGLFLTQDAKSGKPSFMEIQAEGDLTEYNVVSLCFGTNAVGQSELHWRTTDETSYNPSKTLRFRASDGQLRTFSLHADDRILSASEKRIFELVYETMGAATLRESVPNMAQEWQGKLASLVFMPTDRAGMVELRWIALRSDRSVENLMKDRPRELILRALEEEPIGEYGKNVFVRKFQVGSEIEDGVLTFAPSRLAFEVAVPKGESTLTFRCLLQPQPTPAPVDNLLFRITASREDHEDEDQELFRATLQGSLARNAPGAVRHEIQLSRFSGHRILLNFETSVPAGGDWEPDPLASAGNAGIWLDPRIRSKAAVKPDRPNVILVSVDTLRPDHLGAYGYPRDTSPNIDRVAKEGVVFGNAYSTAPWTLPSHMSMLTSQYPMRHGVFEVFDAYGPADQLDVETATLGSVLQDAGYYTFALTDGANLFVAAEYGFCQGFRWMDEEAGGGYLNRRKSARTVRQMIKWLGKRGEAPFFAFIHSYQVHSPYHAPDPFWKKYVDPNYAGALGEEYQGVEDFPKLMKKGGRFGEYMEAADIQHLVNLYDGEVAYFDDNFGKLVAELRRLELLDDTLIIVTADHGEEFGERGIGGLHGHTLYNEQLRVPLIMRWPAKIPAGTVVNDNVSIVDIMPTVLAMCGVEGRDGMQGVDLSGLIGGDRGVARSLFAAGIRHQSSPKRLPGVEQASVTGDHKAIDYGDYEPGKREFYDLASDPLELEDLSATKTPRVNLEFDRIAEHRKSMPGRREGARSRTWAQSDEDRLNALRALGYSE